MKVARITGEQALLKLPSGMSSSQKEIMKNGNFTNLLTHNSPLEDKHTSPEMDKHTVKATQNPYQQMSKRISKAKAHVKTMRKTKKRKMNGDDGGFLQGVPSMSAAVWDRLGFLNAISGPRRNCLVISNLLQPPTRRRVQAPIETIVASHKSSMVSHSSFTTLNKGLWLNDKMTNYMAQALI